MTFRPVPEHRRDVHNVIIPLTAAILRVFGSRAQDGAMPLGVFYTEHLSSDTWQHLGSIWYRPINEEAFANRCPNEAVVRAFSASIFSGQSTLLSNGKVIEWEPVAMEQAHLLPPPLRCECDA